MPTLTAETLESLALFETTLDLVCIAGKDGYFKKVNSAVLNCLGYSEAELFAQPISSFQHPDDRDITAAHRAKLLEGKALVNFHNRYITKAGATVWLHWTSVYMPDKEVVIAIAKNITPLKELELAAAREFESFKGLARHFKTTLEKDRKNFAFELHEELAQLAAALKMNLDSMLTNYPDAGEELRGKLALGLDTSRQLIESIRRISFSVRPYMLDDLGLDETLHWLCKEFTTISQVPCDFEALYEEETLSQEVQLDFFRICQEALKNITQHAQATHAWIRIESTLKGVCLSITDNGKGFDVAQELRGTGILNMRGLATSINGHFELSSEAGKGTLVKVLLK